MLHFLVSAPEETFFAVAHERFPARMPNSFIVPCTLSVVLLYGTRYCRLLTLAVVLVAHKQFSAGMIAFPIVPCTVSTNCPAVRYSLLLRIDVCCQPVWCLAAAVPWCFGSRLVTGKKK